MNKVSLKNSWFFLIIPIGMVIFVAFPQFRGMYDNYVKDEQTYHAQVRELDSLQQVQNPSMRVRNTISRLETGLPIRKRGLDKRKYTGYKTGGMLAVLAVMFVGMFGSSYWVKRKKSSSKNRQISFDFGDFTSDAIGQGISWEPVANSGSNFMSEHLKETRYGFKISSSPYMKFMAWAFFLVGLNYLGWSIVEHYEFSTTSLGFMELGKMFFTSGGVFMLVGGFLIVTFGSKAHIHRNRRLLIVDGIKLNFSELYALQVLEKFVQGNKSGSYYSYEVNLVTREGQRHNLLNHGDKMFILSDMVKIAQALKLPVWNAGVQ